MTTAKKAAHRDAAIKQIATKLGVEKLKTRDSDSLDFHELAVWQIKDALEDAMRLGGRRRAEQSIEGRTESLGYVVAVAMLRRHRSVWVDGGSSRMATSRS
jgi:hypothetical protein